MHRFYLPPEATRGEVINLSARESHHALHVLRLRVGDRVSVLDGVGHEYFCEVSAVDKRAASLAVRQTRFVDPLPCQVTLLQAMPKGKAMDNIVQKATELGVYRIVPILAERTVTQVDEESAAHKVDKWLATAVEAIKQCGSTWLPKLEAPISPKAFLDRRESFDLALIASLQNDAAHPRERFKKFHEVHQRAPKAVCVWVGPEGDFSPSEIAAVQGSGALPVTLGSLVLRSDTAAIYCLSVLNYELQAG